MKGKRIRYTLQDIVASKNRNIWQKKEKKNCKGRKSVYIVKTPDFLKHSFDTRREYSQSCVVRYFHFFFCTQQSTLKYMVPLFFCRCWCIFWVKMEEKIWYAREFFRSICEHRSSFGENNSIWWNFYLFVCGFVRIIL